MGLQQPIDGQEIMSLGDDSWRAPELRTEVVQIPEAEFIPFDSVRPAAIEAARAGVADFFAPMSPEQAQVTMNNRSDQNNL